ncbi:MAG: LecA/PA-IL family lectin [Acidobacteriota bacterium]
MSRFKNISRIFCVVAIAASLAVSAFADTLRLKDGSIIKGRIKSFANGIFTITIGEGTRKREMTFTAADVESIEFDGPQPAISNSSQAREPQTSSAEPVETYKTASTSGQPVTSPSNPPSSKSGGRLIQPISLTVKVLSDNTANGWTNSGWVVKKGQTIRISGTGEISIGRGKKSSPSGLYDLEDEGKLLRNVPTGALIAVIGDDNNDFIYIGSERQFTATRDGALFLGVNEGDLTDNTGTFDVKVEISADSGD